MTTYTTPNSLPILETSDKIAAPSDGLLVDINALALAASTAITAEGARAEGSAKTYADDKDTTNRSAWAAADATNLTSAKTYADSQDVTNLASAKTYADGKDTSNRSAWAAADATNLTAAKTYADAQDVTSLASAKSYADGQVAADRTRLGTIEGTAVFDSRRMNDPTYAHAWSDKNGRTPLGIRLDGTVEAAGGVDTPRAGKNLGTVNNLSYAVTSPGGLVSEHALGPDGCVPSWVLSRWGSRMGITVPAPRTTATALTLSGSTTTPDTATSVQARLPFKLGAKATIKKIHFRNYNDRNGLAYTGALSFSGVYFGTHAVDAVGELTGNFTAAPTQLAGAATTPADGSEYVISGLNIAIDPRTDYLLSYGYTGAAQNNQSSVGGCWRNTTPADVSAATATQTISQTAPLDVWLEIEVAADVTIIAYMGDSLTAGVASALPVYHSYPAKHAQANGHIAVHYAHSGSAMTSWVDTNVVKYTKWAGLSKPDALVFSLGKNDLAGGADLPTMRSRFAALYPKAATISSNFYLTTVLPDANDATTIGAVRRAWNTVLLTELPGNAVACFDLAAAVATATGGLDPLWDSSDGVHLNKAGYARKAIAITQPLHR